MNNFFKRVSLLIGLPLLAVFLLTACSDDYNPTADNPNQELNIVETAEDAGNFTTLLTVATDLGLAETLQNEELTVFAPTDDAFNALPEGLLDNLTESQLTEIILYHVLEGTVESNQIETQQDAETVQGERIFLQSDANGVTVNGTTSVINADISASNGVIHAVDQVLLPDAFGTVVDNAVKRYDLTTLVGLVTDQGLVSTLNDAEAEFTVFAPTNAAFAAISSTLETLSGDQVTNTLLYHVLGSAVQASQLSESQTVATLNNDEEILIEVSEGVVTINGSATVQIADVIGSNGVIHIIDEVLIPEALGGGIPTSGNAIANITINNVGSSAWTFTNVEGNGVDVQTGVNNPTLTLDEGGRYTITNLGASGHPFQLLDASDNVLIEAGGDGTLQDDEDANVVVNEENGTIAFTLTGALAEQVATYICEFHPSMAGDLVVN